MGRRVGFEVGFEVGSKDGSDDGESLGSDDGASMHSKTVKVLYSHPSLNNPSHQPFQGWKQTSLAPYWQPLKSAEASSPREPQAPWSRYDVRCELGSKLSRHDETFSMGMHSYRAKEEYSHPSILTCPPVHTFLPYWQSVKSTNASSPRGPQSSLSMYDVRGELGSKFIESGSMLSMQVKLIVFEST